jgi:DNA topoisomerase-1
VGFTAGMEAALDEVAEGQRDWVALLTDFTGGFYPALEKAAEDMAAVKAGKETGLVCDKCGKPMVIKFGRMGEFLACSGYPECKNTSNFIRTPDGGIELVARQADEPVVVGKCPECGKDLVLKKSRTGSRFVACSGYPACRHAEPFRTGVKCPREGCGGELVEKSSKRGKIFYSCDRYPQCDYAVWDWPVAEPCPKCGSKILVKKRTQAKGEHLACPEKSCRYTRPLDGGDEDGK